MTSMMIATVEPRMPYKVTLLMDPEVFGGCMGTSYLGGGVGTVGGGVGTVMMVSGGQVGSSS